MFQNVTESLYNQYLETATSDDNAQEARLSGLGAAIDSMIQSGTVTEEAVAMYEEAARCAGFYAGIRAALQYLSEADDFPELLAASKQRTA